MIHADHDHDGNDYRDDDEDADDDDDDDHDAQIPNTTASEPFALPLKTSRQDFQASFRPWRRYISHGGDRIANAVPVTLYSRVTM